MVDVICEVAGVAFHGVGVIASVEVLHDEGDVVFLGVGGGYFPDLDAVLGHFFVAEAFFGDKAGEHDDVGGFDFHGDVDCFVDFFQGQCRFLRGRRGRL